MNTNTQKDVVISIVFHAMISLCGREVPSCKQINCCCCICCVTNTTFTKSNDVDLSSNLQYRNDLSINRCITKIDDENDDNEVLATIQDILQWRMELYKFVQSTITFRTISSKQQQLPERTKMYDIEIRTAMAYVQRYGDRTKSRNTVNKEQYNTNNKTDHVEFDCDSDDTLLKSSNKKVITIISDLGVIRTIQSAYQFAYELLLPNVEKNLLHYNISNHVRVALSSGFICCVSVGMMQQIHQCYENTLPSSNQQQQHQEHKLEPCPYCPLWCSGNKGLWWHLQQQHSILYHTATETATKQINRNTTAIVVFQTNDNNNNNRSISDNSSIQEHLSSITNVLFETRPISEGTCHDNPWDCIKQCGTLDEFLKCLQQPQYIDLDCTNERDQYGAAMLHWAAGKGQLDIVQYLIEVKHCPINIVQYGKRSYAGRTPLHWSARYGHIHVVEYLLQYIKKEQDRIDVGNCTDQSNVESSFLYQCIEAKTVDGTTPFCWAAWQGHLHVMQLLYQYGCRIDTVNQFGCNAMLWAAQGSSNSGSTNNKDSSDNIDAINTVSVLEWLVHVNCPDLVINHSGHGILHKAAQRGNKHVCEWFINRVTKKIQEQISNDDKNSCFDYTLLLNVLGPDQDSCTPSDLAGMEQYDKLALYLSEEERKLVHMVYVHVVQSSLSSTSSSSLHHNNNGCTVLPKWLTPLPKGAINCCVNNTDDSTNRKLLIWEPGAGVYRMRSVLSQNNVHKKNVK